jgi:hypothetical protein
VTSDPILGWRAGLAPGVRRSRTLRDRRVRGFYKEFAPYGFAAQGRMVPPRVGEVRHDVESETAFEFAWLRCHAPWFLHAEVGYFDSEAILGKDQPECGVSFGVQEGIAGQLVGCDKSIVDDRFRQAPALQDRTSPCPQVPQGTGIWWDRKLSCAPVHDHGVPAASKG